MSLTRRPYNEVDDDIREAILEQLEPEELAAAVQQLDSDDALDIVADLDEAQREDLLARLPDARQCSDPAWPAVFRVFRRSLDAAGTAGDPGILDRWRHH